MYLGAPDRYRLDSPATTLNPQFAAMLAPLVQDWNAPEADDVTDGQSFEIAGLTITAVAAPGHTEGSMLLRVVDGEEEVIFTGDVVFAGAIGRVDLPGQAEQGVQDRRSLPEQCLWLWALERKKSTGAGLGSEEQQGLPGMAVGLCTWQPWR